MLPVVGSTALVLVIWLAPMVRRALRRRDSGGGSVVLGALFQRAVSIDPFFARAHAGLSFAYWTGNVRDRSSALNRDDFCRAFPMKSDAMRARLLQALGHLGF